ncbi:lysophospholipid acyltransferase family protein [Sulfitobacter sp. LCG007]
MQSLRGLIFLAVIYGMMAILGVLFLPWALLSPQGARAACKTWCRFVFWTARWIVGIRCEIRGEIPRGEVMIAAKHQSFLDIIMIFEALPAARFIMKRELLFAPVIGQYARRIGCIPVDRGKRGAAIERMVRDVEAGRSAPGQLIIYSQGTRVPPGVKMPYKVGTYVLYDQLSQPCVPAATNVGLLWPRKGFRLKPGLAVVRFLPPIPPGLDRQAFMERLEQEVESSTDALLNERGNEHDAAD